MIPRSYSRQTQQVTTLLGSQIRLGRIRSKRSARDFAERIGISRTTLHKIENGDLKCEIGIVLEAAVLAGVPLFSADPREPLAGKMERVKEMLTLLPQAVRSTRDSGVDDDF